MRQMMHVMALLAAGTAGAQETSDTDWTPLTGDDIRTALEGRTVQYDGAWQDFRASGATLYNAGHDSWGYWRVEGERYCSMWPPSDLWRCYRMDRKGKFLRFVGTADDITEATYKD